MTLGEWLRSRDPQLPAALLARLQDELGGALDADMAAAPAEFLAAGERLAASLIASGATTRESALELLAADALVTYAFEAASVSPSSIEHDAARAMERIAALGVAGR